MVSWNSRSMILHLLPLMLLLNSCIGREEKNIISSPLLLEPEDPRSARRLHGPGVHRDVYCGLQDTPITYIVKNETIGRVYEVDNENSNATLQTYAVKPCNCYEGLLTNMTYCPADSTYCSYSVAYDYQFSFASRIQNHEAIVTCYRDTQLIGFARYVWKYCTIIFAALIIVLVFTDTGRLVASHALSRCIPQITARNVELRLAIEVQSQRQHLNRLRERISEQGYVSELKLKTKIYHPQVKDTDELEQVENNDQDVDSCSICLLELEDGDRIADLRCKHCFHAECIAEWLKKKNSCPLCQAQGIAEEVRSFDVETAVEPSDTTTEDRNNI